MNKTLGNLQTQHYVRKSSLRGSNTAIIEKPNLKFDLKHLNKIKSLIVFKIQLKQNLTNIEISNKNTPHLIDKEND